jgi:hypothetical protein
MTMVELMVSLAIVMLVIGTAATAYLKLLKTYRSQGRLAESYMANLTGLELLRYDIEMAGFGLPANLGAGVNYSEAVEINPAPPFASPNDPTTLNDAPSGVPRAFVHLDNKGANNSDVLAIKSNAANIFDNPAAKKWSMITNASGAGPPLVVKWNDATMDFAAGDYFVALDNTGTLLTGPVSQWNNAFFTNASGPNGIPGCSANTPSASQIFYIYGIDNNVNNTTGTHRMPFNRVDYYLDTNGNAPSSCASGTYTLYRSAIDQATGKQLNKTPLIDCVMDFQVAFGIDPSGNGSQVVQWQENLLQNAIPGGAQNAPMTTAQIQQYLREVRVFVLYSEGLADAGSSPPGILNLGDQQIAAGLDSAHYTSTGTNFQQWSSSALTGSPQLSSFSPAGADLQYRWKIVEMAVKPNNLLNLAAGTSR